MTADGQKDGGSTPTEKSSPTPTEKNKPLFSMRWWENYLVRYFVGTAVGVAIILYFADSTLALIKNSFLQSSRDMSERGSPNFLVITALGLAYCYAASAPMLSLHAARAQLDLVQLKIKWSFWIFVIALSGVCWGAFVSTLRINWWSKESSSICLFCIVTGVQFALIFAAQINKFSRIENFYRDLSKVRAKSLASISEYVESYRHLREHSNAYAIIVLEFILAMALAVTDRTWQRILIILLWLIPPAYCWIIASVSEARLAANPTTFEE